MIPTITGDIPISIPSYTSASKFHPNILQSDPTSSMILFQMPSYLNPARDTFWSAFCDRSASPHPTADSLCNLSIFVFQLWDLLKDLF
jgi:hypothetical protein